MNSDRHLELRRKLISYRSERSHQRLQINLCIKSHTVIKVSFSFPKEGWYLISRYEALDEWYLKPHYKLPYINKDYFKHDTITRFTMKRTI